MGHNQKQGEGVNHIYTVALAVSLAFFIFGLIYIRYAGHLSQKETIGYVREATSQIKHAIEEHINEEFETLTGPAVLAGHRELLEDKDALGELARGLSANNEYLLIGFADLEGHAIWIDRFDRRYRGDLAEEEHIRKALAGEKSLSGARYDSVNKMNIHYYAVPVYDWGTHEQKGVLFAAMPQDEMRRIVNHSLYAGRGLAHIVDENGTYVVESDSPLSIGIGNSIFDLPAPMREATRQEILGNFAARKAGSLIEAQYGENRLAAYAPLDINNWYVFYAVPEELVGAGLKNLTGGAVAVVFVATCVSVFFIVLLHRVDKKSRVALETLAFVDPVTGHRNYQKFLLDAQEILKKADGTRYAICYCDIKGFKYINDIYGRDVGERMLRYMADFQHAISQPGEVTARIGEDTFVSLRKYKNRREIEQRFESVARNLAVFPDLFSRGYQPELYGGAYVQDEEDGTLTLNDMLDRAIAAQEEVKHAGGTEHLCFYSREMRAQKLWEAELESKMHAALEAGEFTVYFQPKIDIQHGDGLFGAEALVRWGSPERGLIPPARFIDVFEKNGFIIELDRFVLESACRFYRQNVMEGELAPFVLSVNVSRLGLMQPDFIRFYTETKEAYGVPDGRIELEFTESLVFGNQALFQTIVADCKRNGFLCAMDDFGAGYSSLNVLRTIDVDVLKLDRLFFQHGGDPERGRELVRNILSMAKAMDMKTVAEGVDEEALVGQLRAMGCDAIQGYVFSKPLSEADFKEFVSSWHGGRVAVAM